MDPNQQPQAQPVGGQPQPQVQGSPPQPAPQPQVQPQVQRQVQNAKTANPNSTQNSLVIAEIRDGIVIMNDGSFRSVVLAKSINFDLMSPQERGSVELAYQGFLNSLYFDIQIFVRSRRVDIRPYLDKLSDLRARQSNLLLTVLMDDYIGYIDTISSETNIMDKQFYVVVPYYPRLSAEQALKGPKKMVKNVAGIKRNRKGAVVIDEKVLEEAKSELTNRVQGVLNGFLQMGVQSIPLDTQELIELYYDAYNPDTATRQHLQPMPNLNAPVVSKGEGDAKAALLSEEGF